MHYTDISFEYILSGGRWDNFRKEDITQKELEDSLTYIKTTISNLYNSISKELYNNIEIGVEVEIFVGSKKKKHKLNIKSKTPKKRDTKNFETEVSLADGKIKIKGGTFMQHLIIIGILIIGITGSMTLNTIISHKFEAEENEKNRQFQTERDAKQRVHEKELKKMEIEAINQFIGLLQQNNKILVLENSESLKTHLRTLVKDNPLVQEKLQHDENIELSSLDVSKPSLHLEDFEIKDDEEEKNTQTNSVTPPLEESAPSTPNEQEDDESTSMRM